MKKHSKKWFRERIGKTIYRGKLKCTCGSCQRTEVFITDMSKFNDLKKEFHADYIYDCQNVYGIEYYEKKGDEDE